MASKVVGLVAARLPAIHGRGPYPEGGYAGVSFRELATEAGRQKRQRAPPLPDQGENGGRSRPPMRTGLPAIGARTRRSPRRLGLGLPIGFPHHLGVQRCALRGRAERPKGASIPTVQQVIPEQLIELLRPFLRKENAGTCELNRRLRSRDRASEPVRPLDREIDVVRAPRDEGRDL